MIEIELPDGTVLEAPDDADPSAVAKNYLARQTKPSPVDPTAGMSAGEKFTAGIGQAFNTMGQGGRQLIGPARRFLSGTAGTEEARQERAALQSEIEESRKLDAPLLKTWPGFLGSATGYGTSALPFALVPGANTAVGATAIGGLLGAVQPTVGEESRTGNILLGGGLGVGGFGVGRAMGAGVGAAKDKVLKLDYLKKVNKPRDETLAEGRSAGYTVPPSEVQPNAVANILERWAGKASVAQEASLRNQKITNNLVRESLGLPTDVPITPETLTPIKQAAWSVYDQTKRLGTFTADKTFKNTLNEIEKRGASKLTPNEEIVNLAQRLKQDTLEAEDVVESIKTLRFEAKTNLSPFNQNPAARRLGKAQSSAADALEGLIERNISPNNLGKEFVENFRKARVTLGKVGTVERAMVESTGDVSAKKLAQEFAKGRPLTDELKTAAKFAQAFPRLNQMNVNPVPGGSPLDVMAGVGTSVATGQPAWLALALARPSARSAVLSGMFQRPPNYQPGAVTQGASRLGLLQAPRAPQIPGLLAPSVYSAYE